MKIEFKIIYSFLFLLIVTAANGQSDSTLNKEVEVIKAYQPTISDAYKIGTNPLINDTITYSPTFEYRIFSKEVPIEKNINHLPVVTLGAPPRIKSNMGYVKGGFGNWLTPYAELVVNTSPSRTTDFGLQLFHFSSRPNIKLNNDLKVKAPYSNTFGRIFAKNYFRKSVMEWEINYHRKGFNYYGFPLTDSINYIKNQASSATLDEKQALNTASANFKLKNTNARAKLDYTLNFGYDYFWNMTGQTAHHTEYDGLYTRRYRNYQILFDSKVEYFLQDSIFHNYENVISNHQYFHVAIAPHIYFNKDIYELRAGFNLATIVNADSTMLWHISPKIYFIYHPIKGILSLFAGTDGGFSANNYQQAVNQNQYIDYLTDTKPSNNVIDIYGGFKGKISRKLSYLFDVHYEMVKDEAVYYLYQENINGNIFLDNLFRTTYDDINTLTFGGNLRYSSPGFLMELKGNYYLYSAKNLATILAYRPDFNISLNTLIPVTKQIKATISGEITGPRTAYIVSDNTSVTSSSTTYSTTNSPYDLKTILNVNLGAEYIYTKNIGFSLNAQNILNQNYEIWQGYNQPGLLIMLGGHYTF